MFAFNFFDDEKKPQELNNLPEYTKETLPPLVQASIVDVANVKFPDLILTQRIEGLRRRDYSDVKYALALEDDKLDDTLATDLVPGVYEGGYKTWEGSIDLLKFLKSSNFQWSGVDVCEIGCGSGLPGICCWKGGANVTWLDYNQSVIEKVTIPNVVANGISDGETSDDYEELEIADWNLQRAAFVAGDWSTVPNVLQKKFQCLLTAETFYNKENIPKLVGLVKSLMADDGFCLIAGKISYFGVGGSMQDVIDQVEREGMRMRKEWQNSEGLVRVIYRISH